MGKPIFIQQDNTPSHFKLDYPVFCEAVKQEVFDIRLICQPPDSLDFNIIDLGFFRGIQAIQDSKCFDGNYEGERMQQVQKSSHEKKTLEREDRLPTSIPCEPSLLDEAKATLAASNNEKDAS